MTDIARPAAAGARDTPRESILDAAARAISERGADNARLRDIARASGLSIGALQHHFGARDDLLAETFRQFNDESIAAFHASARDGDPRERLAALLQLCVVPRDSWTFHEKWSVWLEFWSASNRDPELRDHSVDIYTSWRAPFRQAIDDGINTGLFQPRAPVEDIVDRLIAAIDGLAVRSLLEPERITPERMLKLLTDSLESDIGASLRVAV